MWEVTLSSLSPPSMAVNPATCLILITDCPSWSNYSGLLLAQLVIWQYPQGFLSGPSHLYLLSAYYVSRAGVARPHQYPSAVAALVTTVSPHNPLTLKQLEDSDKIRGSIVNLVLQIQRASSMSSGDRVSNPPGWEDMDHLILLYWFRKLITHQVARCQVGTAILDHPANVGHDT